MKANQVILKKTILHFIFLQPKTTSQKIKEYFRLKSIKDFYILLQDESVLKDTIARFCTLANIEVDQFRMMYEVYINGKKRDDAFKIEFLKHKAKLAKAFRAN